jgi:citrate synthase
LHPYILIHVVNRTENSASRSGEQGGAGAERGGEQGGAGAERGGEQGGAGAERGGEQGGAGAERPSEHGGGAGRALLPYPAGLFTGISAQEAAERLGVRTETIYSYVSRGLLQSRRIEGRRESRFDPNEVARLAAQRGRGGAGGARGGRAGALDIVVDSGLTLLDESDDLFYRGWSAVEASHTASFEEVALWLFGRYHSSIKEAAEHVFGAEPSRLALARQAVGIVGRDATPLDRYLVALSVLATADPMRHGRDPYAVSVRGARIIGTLVDSLPPASGVPSAPRHWTTPARIADRLWHALAPVAPTDDQLHALNAALVLLADHELAASTLAARVAASAWADIYRVVMAGMAALDGPLHGGVGALTVPLITEAVENGPERAVGARLRLGEAIPGFGHVVYRTRDPRAEALLEEVRHAWPDSAIVGATDGVIEAVRTENPTTFPNVDLAVAALVAAAGMLDGAAEVIFATARIAGWVAHGIEEYEHALRYRPRAVYTGPEPGSTDGPGGLRTSTVEPARTNRARRQRAMWPAAPGASSEV